MEGLNVICHYCGQYAEFVDSSEVYKKSYGMMYLCRDCKAYVGVYKGTNKPLGILANYELRTWKKRAHAAFDPLWKLYGLSRSDAYKMLSKRMNIAPKFTHIGMFDVDDCKRVIEISTSYLNSL